jgi:hypothetical protein
MIAPEKVSLSDFVSRRLNPSKIALAYMRHELAVHSNATSTTLDKQEFMSLIATFELFIEDYEKLVNREARPAVSGLPALPAERTQYVADARS